MKVLLLQDVEKLGPEGEVVEVSDGYARNYLIPNKLAKFADEQTLKQAKQQQEREVKQQKQRRAEAQTLVERLAGEAITISSETTPGGKLYAGLKESEILDRINQDVARLPESAHLKAYTPLKTLGEHKVVVQLRPGYETTVKVIINPANA